MPHGCNRQKSPKSFSFGNGNLKIANTVNKKKLTLNCMNYYRK